MAYKNLDEFIRALENEGELIRIKTKTDTKLEIAEITDRITKNDGMALLFENNGSDFPLLINAFGSDKRMCMALGINDYQEISDRIQTLFKDLSRPGKGFLDKLKMLPLLGKASGWLPRRKKGRGSCQEVVMPDADISLLPVLKCWPYDGGHFVTLPMVHTMDPNSGLRNTGMYRMQVFGPKETGMHWHLHKGSAKHYQSYKEAGKKMPVAVTLGGDPAYTYAATAPLPENFDEYLFAGFIRNKAVRLVKCLSCELEVPEDVDFVIEGYIDPGEATRTEGPFGDHTGFYSLPDSYPVFHICCITHRRGAVYPATIVGIPPQEDAFLGKATEKIFIEPIRMSMAPEILNMHMPVEGVFHNLALVSIKKSYPGQAEKVMNALWGAGQMMFNKMMIVVNNLICLNDYKEIARQVSLRFSGRNSVFFSKGPADVLDHASRTFALGGKLGIDATGPADNFTTPAQTDISKIQSVCSEIKKINDNLIYDGISILIISFSKDRKMHSREIAMKLSGEMLLDNIKFLIMTDDNVNIKDMGILTWVVMNHTDPATDVFLQGNTLVFDGTRKTKKFDGFTRQWPNAVMSNTETINLVDRKWEEYGLGPFISSPSLRYQSLKLSDDAEVTES